MTELQEIKSDIACLSDKMKVCIKNGKEKKRWLNEVVEEIYDDLEFVRDFNRVHKTFKKYKVYWLAVIVMMLLLGLDIKSVIIKLTSTGAAG